MATTANHQALAEIEGALTRKGFGLRFAPRLEAAYDAARSAERNRWIAKYLVVYLVAKLIFIWANLQVSSQIFRVSMTLRLGIVLPLTVIAVILLLRPLPAWVHGVATFTPLIAETALVMLLGRLAGAAISERYVWAAVVGIFAQTLLLRAPFRQCWIGLVVALAVFCALCEIRWPGHFGPPISVDYLIFVIGFSLPSLYERHSRERTDRREFLLNETNRLRMEDILSMNAHLERLSSMDALTGIFNRRYLDSALVRSCAVALEHQRWIGILMIDIDHFKSVNDTSGHQYGDLCLEQVAQALQLGVRAGVDTVARYGGEEFVAILPDADEGHATHVAERIRESIEAAAMPAAQGRVLTVSAGVTAIRGEIGLKFNAEELIATADQALYTAKNSGRNRVIFMQPRAQRRPAEAGSV